MSYLPVVLVAMLGVLMGYAFGRRAGMRFGITIGEARAPLELRAASLEIGKCPVCGRRVAQDNGRNGSANGVVAEDQAMDGAVSADDAGNSTRKEREE